MELAHQTKDKYWKSAVGDSEAAHRFENVLRTFEVLTYYFASVFVLYQPLPVYCLRQTLCSNLIII